jgi:hypothetical protein
VSGARLKHYGWGREGESMTAEEQAFVLGRYRAKFARDAFETKVVPRLDDLTLRAPRVVPPASLAAFCTSEKYDRAAHAYGKSYPDYVRAMLGEYDSAPDVVAYPRSEAEISAVMDWAGGVSASLTPFGGGSSVCGGVEPRVDGISYKAAVTLDLRNLDKVVEVDQVSRAALIEGGAFGPSLESQLKPHGVTLRHFPQSFEYSTLGGLDRDPVGRSFRQSIHAHRRFRRKPARRDAARHDGNTPPAGIGCRTEPRSHVNRLRRNARGDFARLDAVAATPQIPCWRIGSIQLILRCGSRAPRDRTGRTLSIELPHP